MGLKSCYTLNQVEAGVDEAGRGCLAGPVVAAAVILPKDFNDPRLNDSKQVRQGIREELESEIKRDALAYAIAEIGPAEIDKINILNASYRAMAEAIGKLDLEPELLLIDGNRYPGYPGIKHVCIVKGDGKYQSIAAASILAKVHRDRLMAELSIVHPEYGWEHNAGYATEEHRTALKDYGHTVHHRLSFLGNKDQLDLF